MPGALPFPKYTLRSRLLVLGGATFFLCACVILLFFPLLDRTLEGLMDRSVATMRKSKETEANTIARLLVLEFAQIKDLLQVKPGEEKSVTAIDEQIMNLIWEMVTFNEIIEGIELIHAPADSQGRHLTYSFYRRETSKLAPMQGPEKKLKAFSGLERELISAINEHQRVDKNLLDSVNRGPKEAGQMLLRYLPVHVLVPEEGAIFWGVAKIGIDTSAMSNLLLVQSQEQERLRRAIWLEILLSLAISGILALGLLYLWARRLTEPMRDLSVAAGSLKHLAPPDFQLWLDNLRRVESRGQAEVADLQETLLRVGSAVSRLGQRLLDTERLACLGKLAARVLATIPGSGPQRQELAPSLRDWQRFQTGGAPAWQTFDLAPGLESAWRLGTLGLPAEVQVKLDLQPLPHFWGSPTELELALLYLLTYGADFLSPGGSLFLRASSPSPRLIEVVLEFSGPAFTPEDCRRLLNPFTGPEGLAGFLGPALAAAVATQHGGILTVRPRPQGGLRFLLHLPSTPVPHEQLAENP